MMGSTEIGDLIEAMVTAWAENDKPALVRMVDGLLKGQVGNTLNVVLVLAGVLADEFDEMPPEGFHRVSVTHVRPDGSEREGSASELPPHVAIFAQMVAALANGDRSMAIDLFIGYVGFDGLKALPLVVFAVSEVVHLDGSCPKCHPPVT